MHMLNVMLQVKGGLSCHADLLSIPFVIAPWYMVSVWIIDHMLRLESMQGMLRVFQTMPYLQLIQFLPSITYS